jgi:hypothetical protein
MALPPSQMALQLLLLLLLLTNTELAATAVLDGVFVVVYVPAGYISSCGVWWEQPTAAPQVLW